MGRLRVVDAGVQRDTLLFDSMLVGRHWSCSVQLDDPRVPLYWIEVRWLHSGWSWRVLAGAEDTRGTGANRSDGWRELRANATGALRVRCGEHSWIACIDPTPPRFVIVDVSTGHFFTGHAAHRVAGKAGLGRELRDGEHFLVGGRVFVARVPQAHFERPPETGPINVAMGGVELYIDLPGLSATFAVAGHEATIRGECVRVLFTYAEAKRAAHGPYAGYLSTSQAFASWLAAGGSAESPIERLGWERGRVRARALREGVSGIDGLFETDRPGPGARTRLAFDPDSIFLVRDDGVIA